MERSNGIGDCHLNVFSGFLCSLGCAFKVPRIVACIENPEDSDSVCSGCLYEFVDYIVCIMAVSQKVLSAEEHHYLVVRKCCMKLAEAFPWIFIQKADAAVICSSTPSFNGPITDFVDHTAGRKHICSSHSRRMK